MTSMSITVEAIYENGLLRPMHALPLPDRSAVKITVHAPTSIARESAGIIPWNGELDTLERMAKDPEFGILESP
jgi:predicted DNA-binding antitoxin AbrB/MazE fold protein